MLPLTALSPHTENPFGFPKDFGLFLRSQSKEASKPTLTQTTPDAESNVGALQAFELNPNSSSLCLSHSLGTTAPGSQGGFKLSHGVGKHQEFTKHDELKEVFNESSDSPFRDLCARPKLVSAMPDIWPSQATSPALLKPLPWPNSLNYPRRD